MKTKIYEMKVLNHFIFMGNKVPQKSYNNSIQFKKSSVITAKCTVNKSGTILTRDSLFFKHYFKSS